MGRYSKTTSGQRQHVFVSGSGLNYTDDTTFAAFIDNAPEGEIGIFLSSGAIKTDALTANQEFFIAQKRDSAIHKTPILKFNDIVSKRKQAYTAPVRKVVTVGYNGTSGDVGLDFTGASSTNAQDVAVSVRETTPGNQPFPVQEGRVVVTSASQDEYSVLHKICQQINGDLDYARTQPDRFVKAEILANGSLTAFGQTLAVVNGSNLATAGGNVTFAAGTKLSIAGTIYALASAVSAGTAIVLDRNYQGTTATVSSGTTSSTVSSMAYTSGTTLLGLRFTGLYDDEHFLVQTEDGLTNSTTATATEWVMGSGYYAMVADLEAEGQIFAGLGSIPNTAFKADYGIPTNFASASLTYDLYFIDLAPFIIPSAGLPVARTQQLQKVIIAAQSSGTTASDELTTILAV